MEKVGFKTVGFKTVGFKTVGNKIVGYNNWAAIKKIGNGNRTIGNGEL